MADWNPELYKRFEDERTRPARELLGRVELQRPASIVDLGCGPGNSTELLVQRFPDAGVLGIDNSPAMISSARERLPGCRFELGDIGTWQPATPPDLIYANAALQWTGDHPHLLPRLFASLAPGGVLAVQMPDNLNEPSHVAMRETALAGIWADKLRRLGRVRDRLPAPEAYYNDLKPDAARIDIWHTIYNHPLEGAAGIVEWVKGTGLRPYIDPLDEAERKGFLALYQERIAKAYPPANDGKVLLRFPRLFIVCVR